MSVVCGLLPILKVAFETLCKWCTGKNVLWPNNRSRFNCSYFYEYQLDMIMLISVALDEKHREKRTGEKM